MKNKNFLSKFEELKPNVPVHLDVERKLLPRLKFMGYVMYSLCLVALTFAIAVPTEPGTNAEFAQEGFAGASTAGLSLESDDNLLELNPTEVLNFYVVSFAFALVGTICFFTAWKKRKTLFREPQANGE